MCQSRAEGPPWWGVCRAGWMCGGPSCWRAAFASSFLPGRRDVRATRQSGAPPPSNLSENAPTRGNRSMRSPRPNGVKGYVKGPCRDRWCLAQDGERFSRSCRVSRGGGGERVYSVRAQRVAQVEGCQGRGAIPSLPGKRLLGYPAKWSWVRSGSFAGSLGCDHAELTRQIEKCPAPKPGLEGRRGGPPLQTFAGSLGCDHVGPTRQSGQRPQDSPISPLN